MYLLSHAVSIPAQHPVRTETAAINRARPNRQMTSGQLVGPVRYTYTQFELEESRLFGPNPWKILAPPSNHLSKKGFRATQQILVAEFLLCELGVHNSYNPSEPRQSRRRRLRRRRWRLWQPPERSYDTIYKYIYIYTHINVCVYIYIYKKNT